MGGQLEKQQANPDADPNSESTPLHSGDATSAGATSVDPEGTSVAQPLSDVSGGDSTTRRLAEEHLDTPIFFIGIAIFLLAVLVYRRLWVYSKPRLSYTFYISKTGKC